MERFLHGAAHLKIRPPFSPEEIQQFAVRLIKRNRLRECLLRLTLSRGVGLRGYSPKGADSPKLVMTLHPLPKFNRARSPLWKRVTASNRLPTNEPLALFKTANKLPQILARAEADAAGADEALLFHNPAVRVPEQR